MNRLANKNSNERSPEFRIRYHTPTKCWKKTDATGVGCWDPSWSQKLALGWNQRPSCSLAVLAIAKGSIRLNHLLHGWMDPERAAGEPHQQSSGFWHGTRRNFSAPSSVLEYIQMIVQMFNSDDYPIITVIYPPCPTVKLCGWETQFVAPTGSPFFVSLSTYCWVPRVSKKPWVVMPWCTYPE